ncbi:hypothetical protein Hanom_Chr14g01271171 [Helianthus anomalus]
MDPQCSTGRNTDVEFEDVGLVGDHIQLSAYQSVTIDEVLNPNSTNGNAYISDVLPIVSLLIQMFKLFNVSCFLQPV